MVLHMETESDLVGTRDAAEIIGCERSTLSRWVALGKLPLALQLTGPTGAHLFHRADVDRLAVEYRSNPRKRPTESHEVAS
jgi:predicted site-specific integrase-resolvase